MLNTNTVSKEKVERLLSSFYKSCKTVAKPDKVDIIMSLMNKNTKLIVKSIKSLHTESSRILKEYTQ